IRKTFSVFASWLGRACGENSRAHAAEGNVDLCDPAEMLTVLCKRPATFRANFLTSSADNATLNFGIKHPQRGMYFEVCGVGTKENTLALRSKIDRRVAVLAVAVATAVALTSCGTPGPVQSPDGEGAPAANTGSASAWVMSGTAEEAFNASFARWNDAHPDELISTETFANDAYKQKIRPAIGAGEAPTLIYGWGGATLADYVATDSVIDLSDLLDTTALGEDLLPAVLQSGEVDGKLYGIPNNIVKPVVLYYNKDVFND